ncbi:MAG: type II secretion system protein [Planctomycetota bacterium]
MQRGGLRAAFTLIELLVAISIIALLMGVLLPVLGSSRSVAQSMVCNANQRSIVAAIAVYAVEHDTYLPGPNTSGFTCRRDEGRSDSPVSADDWYSPSLGRSLGLPDAWQDRVKAIFNDEFRCPLNDLRYDYIHGGGADLPLPAETLLNSYGSPMGLHHYQDFSHARDRGQTGGATMGSQGHDASQVDVRPANYDFRIDSVGSPSGKVFVYDGVRYVSRTGDGWRVSWSTAWKSNYGTNFITRSPVLNANYAFNGSPHYFADKSRPEELPEITRINGYRHHGGTIGLGFLDGHVKSADSAESRNVNYYFPTGTVIRRTNNLADPNAEVGDVVR